MKSGSASPSYEPARPADAREGVTDWNRDTVRFIPPEPASAGADGIATLLPSGQLSLPTGTVRKISRVSVAPLALSGQV
jgi:hypothetical protein